ncbi:MAG: FecR family protein [Pedobacter sp.]
MDEEYYKQLVNRYLSGKCSNEELTLFSHLMSENKLDLLLLDATTDNEDKNEREVTAEKIRKVRLTFPAWLRYVAAATIIIALSLPIYLNLHHPQSKRSHAKVLIGDAMPGSNRAILALANGTTIKLGVTANGNNSNGGNGHIVKVDGGKLIVNTSEKKDPIVVLNSTINTLSTPRGGQYQLELPDGTRAWINASSSVTFPTVFSSKQRKVRVSGEVYFEVAKNPNRPFIVETEHQTVTVLGTHFNINAYNDEQETKTTLIEGSVRVASKYGSRVLIPGQQSILSANKMLVKKQSNLQSVIAWKNGNFSCDHTDLPVLLRQLSRWYDVEIVYTGVIGKHEFVGEISRSLKLSSVLKILESSGVHFKINDKKLIIQP